MKSKETMSIKDGTEEITERAIEKDGITTSIKVRKVMNGYVVTVCESGYKKEKWINNEQTYISVSNPLVEENEKTESFKETMKSALKNLKLK